MELSKRLKLVVSFVEQGATVADVGTDHGYVPIYLIQQGIAVRAIAMDVNRGPLERAKSHIEGCGLSGWIETRLGHGLSQLAPGEADTVIIAGMGGPLTVRILTDGLETARTMDRLILSPQSEIWSVRRFLEQKGFAVTDEAMTEEAGKYYTVICAKPQRVYIDGTEIDETYEKEKNLEWEYGRCLLEQGDPVLKEFLRRERRKYQEVLGRLGRENDTDSPRRLARKTEVEEKLALIGKALSIMGVTE